jgi:protein phosphatase
MDRIAVISDLHGNIPALEATLYDIKRRDIRRIFCLDKVRRYFTVFVPKF